MLACGILEPLNQFIAALTLLNVNLISFQLGVCFEFGRCKVNQFSFVLYPWFLIKIRRTHFLVTNVGVRSASPHRYLYALQDIFATFVSTFLRGLVETMMSSDECPKLCPPLLVSAELTKYTNTCSLKVLVGGGWLVSSLGRKTLSTMQFRVQFAQFLVPIVVTAFQPHT